MVSILEKEFVMDKNGNIIRWVQWIILILVSIFMGISGYTAHKVDSIPNNYVATKQYEREYGTFCGRLDRLEDKIDRILEYQRRGK